MGTLDHIDPLIRIQPTKPGTNRLPDRKIREKKSSHKRKPPPANEKNDGDNNCPHVDEYA